MAYTRLPTRDSSTMAELIKIQLILPSNAKLTDDADEPDLQYLAEVSK